MVHDNVEYIYVLQITKAITTTATNCKRIHFCGMMAFGSDLATGIWDQFQFNCILLLSFISLFYFLNIFGLKINVISKAAGTKIFTCTKRLWAILLIRSLNVLSTTYISL